ncbi:hypothetical protein AALA79_20450 [Lachnospiraceae bacterium 64-25]|nr:hypothetical protein IMSAGC005_02316 [Lachnospiraceae bacterium]
MSESVRIGGIGKNPAIDKINRLNEVDIKRYAVKKMEELLLDDGGKGQVYDIEVPIDFSRAVWEEKEHGEH